MAPSAVSPEAVPTAPAAEHATKSKEVIPGSKHAPLPTQTPLEAISHGGVVMPGIPTFPSFMEHRRHILIHMAATFRYFSRCDFTEGQSGHISVRDPEHPGLMWMNPLGRHFGMLTAGDMICLRIEDGKILSTFQGKPHLRTINSAGYNIHSAVHKRRHADVHAICHAHTNAGRAWSVFAKPLEMLNQDICFLHDHHAVYADYGGIAFGSDEGEAIASALGEHNKAAILMNHGLITVGATVDEAGFLFGIMDRSCAMQLQVEAAAANGLKKNIISDEEARYNFIMASEENALYREAQPDLEYEMEACGGEHVLERGFSSLAFIS